MYTSFSIENFRLFDQLTVEPLARVNLITGQNNSGKTALLEAIMVHATPDRPERVQWLAQERGLQILDEDRVFTDLFYRLGAEKTITISASENHQNAVRVLTMRREQRNQYHMEIAPIANTTSSQTTPNADYGRPHALVFEYSDEVGRTIKSMTWLESENETPEQKYRFVAVRPRDTDPNINIRRVAPIPSHFRLNENALAADFGKALLEQRLPIVEGIIQLVEPKLRSLTAVPNTSGGSSIYASFGPPPMMPIALLGEGAKRLLSLTLKFTQADGRTIVVDEIENGIHFSVLHDVWKQVALLSKAFDAQVFATTHSYECIVAANNAFTELESDELHVHRLYRQDERVKVQTYTKAALDTNIEYLWELR